MSKFGRTNFSACHTRLRGPGRDRGLLASRAAAWAPADCLSVDMGTVRLVASVPGAPLGPHDRMWRYCLKGRFYGRILCPFFVLLLS